MKNMVLLCAAVLCGGLIMGCEGKDDVRTKIEKIDKNTGNTSTAVREDITYDGPGTRVEDHNCEELKEKLNAALEKMNNR